MLSIFLILVVDSGFVYKIANWMKIRNIFGDHVNIASGLRVKKLVNFANIARVLELFILPFLPLLLGHQISNNRQANTFSKNFHQYHPKISRVSQPFLLSE